MIMAREGEVSWAMVMISLAVSERTNGRMMRVCNGTNGRMIMAWNGYEPHVGACIIAYGQFVDPSEQFHESLDINGRNYDPAALWE